MSAGIHLVSSHGATDSSTMDLGASQILWVELILHQTRILSETEDIRLKYGTRQAEVLLPP